jgi:hypothetical protein
MKTKDKVIKNGKVAVLISPGFGAGWSTWNYDKEIANKLLFHPRIVEMVEQGRNEELTEEWLKENCDIDTKYICVLGADGLKIEWLPLGTSFIVEEYDGSESIRTHYDLTYTA